MLRLRIVRTRLSWPVRRRAGDLPGPRLGAGDSWQHLSSGLVLVGSALVQIRRAGALARLPIVVRLHGFIFDVRAAVSKGIDC